VPKKKSPADDRSGDLFDGGEAPPAPPRRAIVPEAPSLPEFAQGAYLAYAMSVVKGRALPSAEDGQKPVQRRILYAMRELGNRSDAPFKKSARIVGDVIGKFHPHGDTAVYDAAVRMAQGFTLRYPPDRGPGQFRLARRRQRRGDALHRGPAHAARRARPALGARPRHRGFVENYDGSFREPRLLPARLPVMLMNGSSGIAVGMATEIPPHNLREVAESVAQMLEGEEDAKPVVRPIKGPDFPGGGQIISSREEIKRAYETGRGSIRVRARWSVEKLARGQYRVAVTELPPNTSAARVLSEIDELVNPKAKSGKKSLTPDQLSLKNATLALLESQRDDSDAEHPVRLVFEPRTSKVDADELMNFLLAHTSMEATSRSTSWRSAATGGRGR
jgi:topoisomerase-4 subunit A